MYRTDFWTLWEKPRVGCFKRTASKYVFYLGWNRSPAQVGCMRQVLGPGALGRPRGIGQRGRWEWGSGWGTHVKPWLILVNVWQKPLQYCKVISLQLTKKKKKRISLWKMYSLLTLWFFPVSLASLDEMSRSIPHVASSLFCLSRREGLFPADISGKFTKPLGRIQHSCPMSLSLSITFSWILMAQHLLVLSAYPWLLLCWLWVEVLLPF